MKSTRETKMEKAVREALPLHRDLRVRDFTMFVAAPDGALGDLSGWMDVKDGDMVALFSFKWKNPKAREKAQRETRALLERHGLVKRHGGQTH